MRHLLMLATLAFLALLVMQLWGPPEQAAEPPGTRVGTPFR